MIMSHAKSQRRKVTKKKKVISTFHILIQQHQNPSLDLLQQFALLPLRLCAFA